MSRFQATTNRVLERQLETIREQLGLEPHQKADLLRELAEIASWILNQSQEGRQIRAATEGDLELGERLIRPSVERLRTRALAPAAEMRPLRLSSDELTQMDAILAAESPPNSELQATLRRISSPEWAPPQVVWDERRTEG